MKVMRKVFNQKHDLEHENFMPSTWFFLGILVICVRMHSTYIGFFWVWIPFASEFLVLDEEVVVHLELGLVTSDIEKIT